MHARHRSPVTGYKSNSMLMGGVATASQVSSEGSVRGRGLHNSSEYRRNYNRGGFGRGLSKQQFVFPQPSLGNDIFMEAGLLAAEYLVSKGLLPPDALSGILPNGCSKRFKTQDFDEGWTASSASAAADVCRRRFLDEHNLVCSRNYFVGGRRSLKSYRSEFNREFQRSGSSDRARAYPDVECQDDTFPCDRDEQQGPKGSNRPLINSLPGKINPDIESAAGESMGGDLEPGLGDSGTDTVAINSLPSVGESEPNNKSDDIDMSKKEADPVNSSHDLKKIDTRGDIQVKLFSKENNQTSKTADNLLSLCRFSNVPTRTRSSMANRGLKGFHDSVAEDDDETEVHSQDDVSVPGVILSHPSLDADKLKPPQSVQKEEPFYSIKQLNEASSSSLAEITLMREGERIEGLSGFGSCSSIAMGRGEKRELDDDDDCRGGTKRPRELASLTSSIFSEDGFLYNSNSLEKQETSQREAVMFSPEKGLVDIVIPKDDASLGSDFTGKQHMPPGSIKTFDLNLMEASDVNENHDAHTVHIFPMSAEGVKQKAPGDIHLTNSSVTSKYAKPSFDGRDVEVIDLENDSELEDKSFNNPARRSETVFNGTDGFTDNARSTSNIPNAQDGYGLMISELLGSDLPNCSSIPADMNSLHNDMGLHNGEGMLGDDDSIYMSLGEIPISFLTAWEQPAQEFGKPF